jgi:TPR repeat protein
MDEPVVETEVADSEPQRRSGPWKLIIIVAVLTLIGVWLVPGDKSQEDPAVTERPQGEPGQTLGAPSLLADGPGGEPDVIGTATPAPEGQEVVDDRPGARARALIARMRADGNIDLDQVVASAQRSQIAGELADAYLLYFFAAREGSVAAALELGKQADPASRDPLSSVFEGPDLNQAHKWYRIAAENGDAEARDRLADLHARVEQMAASGDPQAQRISLLWQ